jgi:galactose mutarotase-like enzyme
MTAGSGAAWVPVTESIAGVVLSSDELEVHVVPGNGGDVYSIIDRRTGVDLLWKAPWGTGLEIGDAETSRGAWLTRAWGGWQLLLPNTGDEAREAGRTWGFHGEAGLRDWTVVSAGRDELELVVDLESAPLQLRRVYRVDGPALSVTTTVRNLAAAPTEFLWGEHPTFGEAFASGATLEIDAEWMRVDSAGGLELAAGDRISWPGRTELAGESLDRIPTGSPARFLFGYLGGLREGTYLVRNDRLGLSARVTWPLDVFPCVWLWEEIHWTMDAPWNGQAYAVGIEPQAAYPAVGMTELRALGRNGLTIEPEGTLAATITITVRSST